MLRKIVSLILYLFIATILIQGGPLRTPTCEVKLELMRNKFVGTISFILSKDRVENEIRIKVTFYSVDHIDDKITDLVTIRIKDKENVLRDVAAGEPITFHVVYDTHKNVPQIAEFTINNKILCKEEDKFDKNLYQKKYDKTYRLSGPKTTTRLPILFDRSVNVIEANNFSDDSCGTAKNLDGFLYNAERKKYSKFPWVTAVYSSEEFLCSATFISRTRAVTAAHCFKNVGHSDELSAKFLDDYVLVTNYEEHPKFDEGPEYDIAYFDIEEIIDTNFVPICLTDVQSVISPGIGGSVLSWGKTEEEGEEEDETLKGAEFSVVPNDDCIQDEGSIPKHSFCVGRSNDDAWLCHGDSGAGFMTDYKGQYFLRGVVSAVISESQDKSCTIEDTVIFTEVSKFLSFITKNA